jgi:hypothetical protein
LSAALLLLLLVVCVQLQACMLTLGSAAKVEELAQLVEKHKPKK